MSPMEDKATLLDGERLQVRNHGGQAHVLRNALPDDACRQTGWGE